MSILNRFLLSLILGVGLCALLPPTQAALNDTGITTCSNDTQNGLPCPVAGFPRQDAEYGINSFDFIKIDASGQALPVDAATWDCVQDNVTGLMWEVKTDDGGLRDKDNTYTDDALRHFATNVNNAGGICGFTDWRLPNLQELAGIVDYSVPYPGPTINTDYFPNSLGTGFWTAWPSVWSVDFGYGYVDTAMGSYYAVRFVRGGQSFTSLNDNGDGTITDTSTGLMWAKCAVGQTGSDCSTGSATTMNWAAALTAGQNSTIASHMDWRLPNAKELHSIVDYSRCGPAINSTYFPNTPATWFWSSSSLAYDSSYAWYVYFDCGYVDYGGRPGYGAVRFVRGGQSFLSFNLTVNKTGSGAGTVISDPAGINCGSTCSYSYNANTVVSLSATPNAGSNFSGWSGDADCVDGAITLYAQRSCTATFNLNTYSVTPTAGSGGSVSPTTAQTVNHGTTKAFTVTANSGYTRSNTVGGDCPQGSWSGDIWTTGAITANCTVSFSFIHTVTLSVGTGGTVTPSSGQIVNHGDTASFDVIADTGYTTSKSVGGTCPQGRWNGNIWTTGAITANCTVSLSFILNTYTVTPSASSGGSVDPNISQIVNHGTTKSFTVTAAPDYSTNFTVTGTCPRGSWSGNIWTTEVITADCTVIFDFTPITSLANGVTLVNQSVAADNWKYYTITVPTNATNLTFTTSNATGDIDIYTQFDYKPTATAYICRPFSSGGNETCAASNPSPGTWWLGVYGYAAASYSVTGTVTIPSNTYTVTPSAGTGGSVNPNTAQTVSQGATKAFTVTANSGYTKSSTVGGTCPPGSWSSDTWTTGAITANCTVSFSFTPNVTVAKTPRAIIIGGRTTTGDVLANMLSNPLTRAYSALKAQGFRDTAGHDEIRVMWNGSQITLPSGGILPQYTVSLSDFNAGSALSNWAKEAERLVVYMIGHGEENLFYLDQPSNVLLQKTTLDGWFDFVQPNLSGGNITLVYEACHSGAFLTALQGNNRLLLTSAAADQRAIFLINGLLSYSYSFWSEVEIGHTLKAAQHKASLDMHARQGLPQTPQLDANNNGIANEVGDIDLVANLCLGFSIDGNGYPVRTCYSAASSTPTVLDAAANQTISATQTAALWLTVDPATDANINSAWAIVTRPDFVADANQSFDQLPVVTLTRDPTTTGKWLGSYFNGSQSGFNVAGDYGLAYYVKNTDGLISSPALRTVTKSSTFCWACLPSAGGWRSAVYATVAAKSLLNRDATTSVMYEITPWATSGGTISPDLPILAAAGTESQFTVTANAGYTAAVSGSCGGSLIDDVFTTKPLARDCDIAASFSLERIAQNTPSPVRVRGPGDGVSAVTPRNPPLPGVSVQETPTHKFSFTKLDNLGQELPELATDYACVRDNLTGLIWEAKTQDGGLRDQQWTYTWYDSTVPDAAQGTANAGNCYDQDHCDSAKFIQAVNTLEPPLCGSTDWRLPTTKELASLLDYHQATTGPLINRDYFPEPSILPYWTADSGHVLGGTSALVVDFSTGGATYVTSDATNSLRLVHSAP